MAKLRHIAMQVPNLQESASYYEKLFELDRVCDVESEYGNAVMLSDGTMNLYAPTFSGRYQGRQKRAGLGRIASHRFRRRRQGGSRR